MGTRHVYDTDMNVTEAEGFKVGDKIVPTEKTNIERRMAGISAPTVALWAAGGTIVKIVQHRDKIWTSMQVRLSDGDDDHWELPKCVQRVQT